MPRDRSIYCRHFHGLLGPGKRPDHVPCDKGHDLRKEFGGPEGRPFGKLPCCTDPYAIKCGDFEGFTKEELAEEERQLQSRIQRMALAAKAINEVHQQTKEYAGQMECPICKIGTLHWNVSPYNKHKRGVCTTDGCVGFME
jgi:hypothetical protein